MTAKKHRTHTLPPPSLSWESFHDLLDTIDAIDHEYPDTRLTAEAARQALNQLRSTLVVLYKAAAWCESAKSLPSRDVDVHVQPETKSDKK